MTNRNLKGQKSLNLGKVSTCKKKRKLRDMSYTRFIEKAKKEGFEVRIELPYVVFLYDQEIDTKFSMIYKDSHTTVINYRESLAKAMQERSKMCKLLKEK